MASSYPPPFESSGEVKEGFICPLCLKDLQSFYQLQEHYEEEHSGDERHVRGQLKSELLQYGLYLRAWFICSFIFWVQFAGSTEETLVFFNVCFVLKWDRIVGAYAVNFFAFEKSVGDPVSV